MDMTNGSEIVNNVSNSTIVVPKRTPMAGDEAIGPSLKAFISPVQRYEEEIFHSRDENETRFTIVMQTYKRVKTLPNLLLHYCKTKYLSKIIVIWNDVGTKIPESILTANHRCAVPIVFIEETVNKMTNRYKPRPEIETDCEYVGS